MYTVKFCTLNDLNDIERIIDSKKTYAKHPFELETKQKIKEFFKEKLTVEDTKRKIIGLYDQNNILKGFMSIVFWEILPFWSIHLWYRENAGETLGLNYLSNGYIDIVTFAHNYANSLGRFDQYSVWDERSFKTTERLLTHNMKDHIFLVESYYKKGDLLKYKLHDSLFDNLTYAPYNCYVAKVILKHEHRFKYIKNLHNL